MALNCTVDEASYKAPIERWAQKDRLVLIPEGKPRKAVNVAAQMRVYSSRTLAPSVHPAEMVCMRHAIPSLLPPVDEFEVAEPNVSCFPLNSPIL